MKTGQNFRLNIEYDGTPFSGWQRQQDETTVQGEIEKALSTIIHKPIHISGSGRTDAGVHALGQVASFKAETNLSCTEIKNGLNRLIKSPIVIHDCMFASDDFHAQYSAVSKEYQYVILNRENPSAIGRSYHLHIRNPLDLGAVQQCCRLITGRYNFQSFENTGSPRKSTIRKVFFATITRTKPDKVCFDICANGFLKNMVRNIVGTLILVGLNKIPVAAFDEILHAYDRTRAGPTAPAHGLFLKRVNYA